MGKNKENTHQGHTSKEHQQSVPELGLVHADDSTKNEDQIMKSWQHIKSNHNWNLIDDLRFHQGSILNHPNITKGACHK